MLIKYYKQWLSETGTPILVKPLRFLGYIYTGEYARAFIHEGKRYYCERWKVEDEHGESFEAKFRLREDEYVYPDRNEVGWNYTKLSEAISDDIPNMHFDSIKYLHHRSVYTPFKGKTFENHHLDKSIVRTNLLIGILMILADTYINRDEELYKAIAARINYICSPSKITSAVQRNISKETNIKLDNLIVEKIKLKT